ncbi:hypothetical protein [Sphingomonas paucimobilis]|uniref:hypothetical protein n=1 Tax=Sphingomonas paucimobilis TaxID=13689 RepID=UPI003D959F3A
MAELRQAIAGDTLPATIRKVGRVGRSADAYAIDFSGRELIAVYDRRGQSIATFLVSDDPAIGIIPALPVARTEAV